MARNFSLDRLAKRADAPGGRRRGTKRLAAAGVILVTLLLTAFLTLPQLAIDTDAARDDLVARLQTMTGETVTVEGDVTFSLLPRTRLVARHVRIGTANAFTIDTVVADLDAVLGPLGAGQ